MNYRNELDALKQAIADIESSLEVVERADHPIIRAIYLTQAMTHSATITEKGHFLQDSFKAALRAEIPTFHGV